MKSGEHEDVDVDLGRLLAGLRRDWVQIVLVAAIVTAIVLVLALFATPRYRAETRLIIEEQESVYTRPQTTSGDPILDAEGVTSQVQVITSSAILSEVAAELDLASREEFEGGESALGGVLVAIGLKSPSSLPPEDRVLQILRDKLMVYRVEDSRVIVIQFSSEDPELAARVPNAIAETYVASQRAARLQSTASATEWLEPEIADLKERVQEAEARVAEFREQTGLLMGQNNTVLATQQLAELSSEVSRVRASRLSSEAQAEAMRAAIEEGNSIEALPEVLASGLIQRLREREVELRSEIADLSTTFLSGHPRINALQSQLADLESQIQLEVQKVLQGIETEAETARRRETQLMAEFDRLKAESAAAEEDQVELRALEREATAQRELLESYLTRFREAVARRERNYIPVDVRVFSRAMVPSQPYFPKVIPLALAALAGSLLLMAIVTLLRELFSGRAMRPADTREKDDALTTTGAAATVPLPEGTDTSDPLSDETEQQPRLNVSAVSLPDSASSLGEVNIEVAAETLISTGAARAIFISPEGDEAAAAAVLVAREVADAGLRVLLIDLTASGAASRPMLESKVYSGITNLLASEAQFAEVIHADLYSNCHIIPVGTADPERSMRGIDRLPIIMNSLVIAYDLVVVECGPADAAAVQSFIADDAQLLVSVLDPQDRDVAEAAAALKEKGLGKPLLVTPTGHIPPTAPPDRDVA